MLCVAPFYLPNFGKRAFSLGHLDPVVQWPEELRSSAWKLQKGFDCFKNTVARHNHWIYQFNRPIKLINPRLSPATLFRKQPEPFKAFRHWNEFLPATVPPQEYYQGP